MAYSYPIYHNVQTCHYKSNKSYGGKDTSVDNIVVGSSVKNSYPIAKCITTRHFLTDDKLGNICVFKHSVDGIILKEVIFKDNDGKAGEHILTRSALKRMKGL